MQAARVDGSPALACTPRLPVCSDLRRDGPFQFAFKSANVLTADCRDDTCKPCADVEVGLTRGIATDEAGLREVPRERLEDEGAQVSPVLRGRLVELLLRFCGCLVSVHRKEAAIARNLGLVELAVPGSFRSNGVLLESILA